MSTRRTLIASAVGLTLLAAGGGFAYAQMGPGAGHHPGMMMQGERGPRAERAAFQPGRHIEGRIAFLRAELKITDAQAPAFDRFAEALRQTAKDAQARFEARKAEMAPKDGKPAERPQLNALQKMERRAEGSKFMADASQRMLETFKPLYASLSEEQKKTADELVAHMAGGPRGHGMRGFGRDGDGHGHHHGDGGGFHRFGPRN